MSFYYKKKKKNAENNYLSHKNLITLWHYFMLNQKTTFFHLRWLCFVGLN